MLQTQPYKGPRTFALRAGGIALFYVDRIPLFWSYLANQILDLTDCPAGTFTGLLEGKPEKCDTGPDYQIPDKVFDVIVDLAALTVLMKDENLSLNEQKVFTVLFALRLIGVILYFFSKDERWLIVFPHFFSITLLYRYAFETFDFLKGKDPWAPPYIYFIIAAYFLKFGQEIVWHRNKTIPGVVRELP